MGKSGGSGSRGVGDETQLLRVEMGWQWKMIKIEMTWGVK